jgi:hypothetical protein
MSTAARPFYALFLALILGSAPLSVIRCQPQVDRVDVMIESGSRRASVKGSSPVSSRNLSFLGSIGGIGNLGTRVVDLQLFDASQKPVSYKKLIDGEFLAEEDFTLWSYGIDLTPPKNRSAAAHVSWLSDDVGILMAADLLPRRAASRPLMVNLVPAADARSGVQMPVYTAEKNLKDNIFELENVDDAIFFLGKGWRSGKASKNQGSPRLLISGDWNFTDAEASEVVGEIYLEYKKIFGSEPPTDVLVSIAKFPNQTAPGEWQAETRGRNVTIISSDMPFKSQSVQRLHEQLRHELLHLWIPNMLNLSGNYDWFYEGFALYESLKLAVKLNRIRFEDFLDTLSRAHTIDSAGSQRTSLVQMSANRFSGANTQVYARGMLVAFLCDLALLEQSKGKKSVEDILRELFARHRKPAASADGNSAVLALLKSNPSLLPVVENYIEGSRNLEWTSQLDGAGIEDSDTGPLTSLRVKEKLNGRQKALLDKLGYNNWRKLTPTSK